MLLSIDFDAHDIYIVSRGQTLLLPVLCKRLAEEKGAYTKSHAGFLWRLSVDTFYCVVGKVLVANQQWLIRRPWPRSGILLLLKCLTRKKQFQMPAIVAAIRLRELSTNAGRIPYSSRELP